jgi:hypothetical protein
METLILQAMKNNALVVDNSNTKPTFRVSLSLR